MTLSLIRFDPDPVKTAFWMAGEGVVRDGSDDGYGWHALLAANFGQLSPKPFRSIARPGRPAHLLAYSPHALEKLQAHARDFADPLVLAALRTETAAAKVMPSLAENRTLGFEVRIRPTIRRDREGDRDRTAEIDAYVAACETAPGGESPDRAEVYAEWLAGKLAAGGARMVTARPLEIQRHALLRRNGQRRLAPVQGYSATFAGTLTTAEAELFEATLARGIGRHRAFGYGMLLLKPLTS